MHFSGNLIQWKKGVTAVAVLALISVCAPTFSLSTARADNTIPGFPSGGPVPSGGPGSSSTFTISSTSGTATVGQYFSGYSVTSPSPVPFGTYFTISDGTTLLTLANFDSTGLSLNPSTGTIYGTPSHTMGPKTYTISMNGSSTTSQSYTLTVVAAAPAPFQITPPAAGTAISAQELVALSTPALTTTGGTGRVTYSLTSIPIPAGIVLNTSTGVLSGTPAVGSVGTYSLTITATDSSTPAQSATLIESVAIAAAAPAPFQITPPAAGTAISAQESVALSTPALATTGGTGRVTYSLTSTPTIPSAIVLNTSTGVLSGTPPVGSVGTYSLTITATDSSTPAQSATLIESVAIAAAASSTPGSTTLASSNLPDPSQDLTKDFITSASISEVPSSTPSGGWEYHVLIQGKFTTVIQQITVNDEVIPFTPNQALNTSKDAYTEPATSIAITVPLGDPNSEIKLGEELRIKILNGHTPPLSTTLLGWVDQKTNKSATGLNWTSIASSSDGTHLAAVANSNDDITVGGDIWTSTDSGATWSDQVGAGKRNWSYITSSADGTHLAATSLAGDIWTWSKSDATWTKQSVDGQIHDWTSIAFNADGTLLVAVDSSDIWTWSKSDPTWTKQKVGDSTHTWASIASSADGTHLAAVESAGDIWTWSKANPTWTKQSVDGKSHEWKSITSSSSGKYLVAVEYSGADAMGNIWTSKDFGIHWSDQNDASAHTWTSITSSSNGTHLAAVDFHGDIWISTDSGSTWTDQGLAGTDWSSIASSSDGSHLAAVENAWDIWTYVGLTPMTVSATESIQSQPTISTKQIPSTSQTPLPSSSSPTPSFDIDQPITFDPTVTSSIQITFTAVNSIGRVTYVLDTGFRSPAGMIFKLDSTTGVLTVSTDSSVKAGTTNLTIYALDSGTQTYTVGGPVPVPISVPIDLQFVVPHLPFAITSPADASTLEGSVGQPFKPVALQTINGVGAITYTASGLPAGMGIDANGQISGTPLKAGTYNPIFTATDSSNNSASTKGVTFTVKSTFTWVDQTSSKKLAWSSIASDSTGLKLAAVVTGGDIYTSTDGGVNWIDRSQQKINRIAPGSWNSIASDGSGKHLIASKLNSGVSLSINSGATWRGTKAVNGCVAVTVSADGKVYAFATQDSIWIRVGSGDWQHWMRPSTESHPLTSIASDAKGETFVMGTDRGSLWVFTPSDEKWGQVFSNQLKWKSVAISSDGKQIAAASESNKALWLGKPDKSGYIAWWSLDQSLPWSAVAFSRDGKTLVAAPSLGLISTYAVSDLSVDQAELAGKKTWTALAVNSDGTRIAAASNGQDIWTYLDTSIVKATPLTVAAFQSGQEAQLNPSLPLTLTAGQLTSTEITLRSQGGTGNVTYSLDRASTAPSWLTLKSGVITLSPLSDASSGLTSLSFDASDEGTPAQIAQIKLQFNVLPPPPVITSISPSKYSASSTPRIHIYGNNFGSSASHLKGVELWQGEKSYLVTVSWVSPTEISIGAPTGVPDGTFDIQINVDGVKSALSINDQFTIVERLQLGAKQIEKILSDGTTIQSKVGNAFENISLFSTGGLGTVKYSLQSGSVLPSWIALDSSTGIISSSTPTASDIGTTKVTFIATDDESPAAFAMLRLTFTVQPTAPIVTSVIPSSANSNKPIHLTVAGNNFSTSSESDVTVSLVNHQDPANVIQASNIQIKDATSLTCDIGSKLTAGLWDVLVTIGGINSAISTSGLMITDEFSLSAYTQGGNFNPINSSQTIVLTVGGPHPTIQLKPTGGVGGISFGIDSSRTVPRWISVNAMGLISLNPKSTDLGHASVTFKATDSGNPAKVAQITLQFSVETETS